MSGRNILLLGILREEKCFGAEILMERELRLLRCAKTGAH